MMRGQKSKSKTLNKDLSHESVLTAVLFNIYISGLPITISRTFVCADDLGIVM